MPLFLCRWPNGDCSVVLARTQEDAIVALDEAGNAEGCPITQVRTFQMHFALTDQGGLALERFGEDTKEEIIEFAYPQLEQALDEAYRAEGYADYESLPPDRDETRLRLRTAILIWWSVLPTSHRNVFGRFFALSTINLSSKVRSRAREWNCSRGPWSR